MDCFWAELTSDSVMELLEHEAAKWLSINDLDSVDWLPAEDWATIVCLVGGGQEINTGEAGITEWISSLNNMFPHWKVYISPKLTEPEYAEGKVND